ncbi:hypothetical protein [Luteimonas deserti]|uniref:Uncharacterized protein n=1 Tax=Luteimonas deserti TaxID=2752306 RepID=A0A7Z0TU98_9GAMM|nr:hypothetical protein [Luteimonas deserti]NYZ62631.1 hypothetical protein [Luteimonas deserti]
MPDRKDTPPHSPTADETPGYAEKQPRDKQDVAEQGAMPDPEPDDGGLDREPETTPGE